MVPVFHNCHKTERESRPVNICPRQSSQKLIYDPIDKELKERNIINISQHGFMENRACQTNLISFLDEITSLVDKGNCKDVIYLGCCKRFDFVSHNLLIKKLALCDISGARGKWINNQLPGSS